MNKSEFKNRVQKSIKCPYCIDFFGMKLCFYKLNENTVQKEPFKIRAPFCVDLEKCPDEYKTKEEELNMAKKFENAGSAKTFDKISKISAEKAQVITIKMIPDELLNDYPDNREDVSYTEDLEYGMKRLGFTDPIEVTNCGQPEGQYMIVSGHRRRQAGRKVGYKLFPCIIRHFENMSDVKDYVLMANSQRDSSKDPLLYCKRYKLHEEYLKEIGFKGSVRDEIAKRLGISLSHADRYNAINKVILPVWDMIREETVGMSSVLPLASHNAQEQAMIYDIMLEALNEQVNLTREVVKKIVDEFRNGKRTWAEISGCNKLLESNIATDIPAPQKPKQSKKEELQEEQLPGQTSFIPDEEDSQKNISDDIGKKKKGKDVIKLLDKLNFNFSEEYEFKNGEEAQEALAGIEDAIEGIIEQMYQISRKHNLGTSFGSLLSSMKEKIEVYQ